LAGRDSLDTVWLAADQNIHAVIANPTTTFQ
jgi:hypothetical protein